MRKKKSMSSNHSDMAILGFSSSKVQIELPTFAERPARSGQSGNSLTRRRFIPLGFLCAACVVLGTSRPARAQNTNNNTTVSQWTPTAAGTGYTWSTPTSNWTNGVPNSANTTAQLTNAIAGNQTITLDIPVTLNELDIGAANSFTLAGTTPNVLTLAVNTATTPLNPLMVMTAGSVNQTISTPISRVEPFDRYSE